MSSESLTTLECVFDCVVGGCASVATSFVLCFPPSDKATDASRFTLSQMSVVILNVPHSIIKVRESDKVRPDFLGPAVLICYYIHQDGLFLCICGKLVITDINHKVLLKVKPCNTTFHFERALLHADGRLIVRLRDKMHKKHKSKKVKLDKNKFMVTIYPNVDYAFVVALIAIVDAMKTVDKEYAEKMAESTAQMIGATAS
ncbi:hypothetical protein L1987_87130 [Smallanthus sonchifolius]|nr:hypothetical protein L1987_87130 [Smallanthus sonchifolius]